MTKPIIKQLAHVCIFAQDLAATEAFYRDVLGLEQAFTFERHGKPFGFYLKLDARTFIEVFEKENSGFAENNSINHMCLEVVNLEEAIAHIQSKGWPIGEKKIAGDHTWQAWLADPNGVKIELFEYTEQSMQFNGGVCQANW